MKKKSTEEQRIEAESIFAKVMSDGIRRFVPALRERAAELVALANDANDLASLWISKDAEDFLLHRADVIKSEVEMLQRQIHRFMKQR